MRIHLSDCGASFACQHSGCPHEGSWLGRRECTTPCRSDPGRFVHPHLPLTITVEYHPNPVRGSREARHGPPNNAHSRRNWATPCQLCNSKTIRPHATTRRQPHYGKWSNVRLTCCQLRAPLRSSFITTRFTPSSTSRFTKRSSPGWLVTVANRISRNLSTVAFTR